MSLVDNYTTVINELDDIAPSYLDFEMKDMVNYLDQDLDDSDNKMTIFLNEIKRIHKPFADGSIDTGDIDTILDNIFSRYEDEIVARAKKLVSLQLQLCPFYKQLQQASEEEWKTYVHFIERSRLMKNAPLLVKVMKDNF